MHMPKLSPVRIKTKGKAFFARVWTWVTEIRKWQVVEDWEYELPDQTKIIIPANFIFDGASIPRPLWGILSPTGLLLIPGLIHDFGYRFDYLWILDTDGKVYKAKENVGQEFWDTLFYRVSLEVNDMKIINMLAWLALASLGKYAWKQNRDRNESDVFPDKAIKPKPEGVS